MANYYTYDYEAQQKEREYKAVKLKTNRRMWKFMLFSFLTFGLYPIFFFIPFSFDIDKVAPRRDGQKTTNFLLVYVLSLFSLSIAMDIWHYHIAQRIEEALCVRKIDYSFGTGDFWRWFIFGSFILVGPFVYLHKLCTAMNLLCESYNENPTV